jgi:hypothetical protein
MPKRIAKFVSAIFVGVLAGVPLATISRSEPAAPDNCLANPKGDAPAGAHWYYRIEQGTKRHCWHLREDGESVSQALPSPRNILPPAKLSAPPANPAPRSVADARAELPQIGRDETFNTAAPAAVAQSNDAVRSDGTNANPSTAAVASRWPDPSGAVAAANPQPAGNDSASNMPAESTVSPAPVDAAVLPADADASSYGERGIMPLLVAILGAITLAAAVIVKLGRPRRRQPRTIRVRRGPIWETTDDDRIVLSDPPVTNASVLRPRFARGMTETEARKRETYRQKSRGARA